MGTIAIENMRFYAHHGCFGQERKIGTRFSVDVEFTCDTVKAEKTDKIEDTVNYLEVYQVVKAEMETPSHLLEHVAHRVGKAIMRRFDAVESVRVKVSKLAPPLGGQMDAVCVSISMCR